MGKEEMKKPIEIFKEEQKIFFAKQKEYEERYSERDEEGNIIERAIMEHKGYNFSMSYDALEISMERYAKQENYQLKTENEELRKQIEEILDICNYTSMINDDKIISIRMKLNRLLTKNK